MTWIYTIVSKNHCSIYLIQRTSGISYPYLNYTFDLVLSTGKAIFQFKISPLDGYLKFCSKQISTSYIRGMSRVRQIDRVFDTFWLLVIDLCYETKLFFFVALSANWIKNGQLLLEMKTHFGIFAMRTLLRRLRKEEKRWKGHKHCCYWKSWIYLNEVSLEGSMAQTTL